MEQMAMTIKIEVEVAATAHVDSEIDLNSGLLQSVKRELSFTNDVLVKEEIPEDSTQDDSKQLCVHGASRVAGNGDVNAAYSASLGDLLNVKIEPAEMDLGPTVVQHMDTHYTINKNMSAAVEENTIVDVCNEATPGGRVKEESVEVKWRGNKIKCDYCGQTTTDYNEAHLKSCLGQQKGLQQHLLRQYQTTKSDCFRCSSSVAGPSDVRRSEAAKAQPKPFKCDICDKEYSSERTLYAHKRSHTGIGMSVCRICSAKFNAKRNLKIHLQTHTGEKPYQCDTCNVRFTTNSCLTKHKRVHTGAKPYQCGICNARFISSSKLTIHKRVHTGEKPYHCDTCIARFTTNGALTRHNRVHTGEKPYHCDTCNARFGEASLLTTHKRIHTGVMPYKCKTCNARFTTSNHLTTHKRVHTGEKPYQCNSCNARFTTNSGLITHNRVHTGEKPSHCDTCNARFATNSDLIKHKRVHKGEKPFECTECGSKFTEKGNLNTHVKRRHRN